MNKPYSKGLKLLGILCCLFWLSSCTSEQEPIPDVTIDATVWTGPMTSFTKAAGSDPTQAANQDRMTDLIWLTRGNNGGQIYNANNEASANKENSPAGTEWAVGDISEAGSLVFRPFRAAVGSPKDVVGKNLVLRLTNENIILSVRFTEWSVGRAGGFAYERSTP